MFVRVGAGNCAVYLARGVPAAQQHMCRLGVLTGGSWSHVSSVTAA